MEATTLRRYILIIGLGSQIITIFLTLYFTYVTNQITTENMKIALALIVPMLSSNLALLYDKIMDAFYVSSSQEDKQEDQKVSSEATGLILLITPLFFGSIIAIMILMARKQGIVTTTDMITALGITQTAAGISLGAMIKKLVQQQTATGISMEIPEGKWTFQQLVEVLAKGNKSYVNYEGFNQNELSAPIKEWSLLEKNAENAMKNLTHITSTQNAIRPYTVEYKEKTYHLKVK